MNIDQKEDDPSQSESIDPSLDLSKAPKPDYAIDAEPVSVKYRATHVNFDSSTSDPVELRKEILRLRDELIGAVAREGELRARLEAQSRMAARESEDLSLKTHKLTLAKNRQLETQIDTILHSRTWRIGSFLLKPTKPIRRILRQRA